MQKWLWLSCLSLSVSNNILFSDAADEDASSLKIPHNRLVAWEMDVPAPITDDPSHINTPSPEHLPETFLSKEETPENHEETIATPHANQPPAVEHTVAVPVRKTPPPIETAPLDEPPPPSAPTPHTFVEGSFLYWKADVSGLISAYTKSYPVTPVGVTAQDELVGHVHQIDYQWHQAFRFAGGGRFQRDLWELKAVYTFYHTSGRDTATIPDAPYGSLAGALSYFTDDSPIVEVRSKANLNYNIGDVVLDRKIPFSKKVDLTLISGVRGAYITQNWKVRNTASDGNESKHKMKWRFGGGGVNFGVEGNWQLGGGVSFASGGTFSALYGTYSNTYHATTSVSNPGIINDVDFGDNRVIFGGQFSSGFRWVCDIAQKSQQFSIYALYELNSWFNLNEIYQLSDSSYEVSATKPTLMRSSPVNLQGAVIGASLYF